MILLSKIVVIQLSSSCSCTACDDYHKFHRNANTNDLWHWYTTVSCVIVSVSAHSEYFFSPFSTKFEVLLFKIIVIIIICWQRVFRTIRVKRTRQKQSEKRKNSLGSDGKRSCLRSSGTQFVTAGVGGVGANWQGGVQGHCWPGNAGFNTWCVWVQTCGELTAAEGENMKQGGCWEGLTLESRY